MRLWMDCMVLLYPSIASMKYRIHVFHAQLKLDSIHRRAPDLMLIERRIMASTFDPGELAAPMALARSGAATRDRRLEARLVSADLLPESARNRRKPAFIQARQANAS